VLKFHKEKALWRLIISDHRALIQTISLESEWKYIKIIGNRNKYTLHQYWFPIMAGAQGLELP